MTSNPMVEEVNRLVGNLLAGGSEVCLPGVGTLRAERRPAQRVSRRKVLPPWREVTFRSEERGLAFPAAIASAAHCTMEEARQIYDRWLTRTFTDGVLTVEGVGVMRFKHFTPDPSFDARLNPEGREPVRIRSARFDWAMWVGTAAIVVALFFGGREFLMLYPDEEVPPMVEAAPENVEERTDALAVTESVAEPVAEAETSVVLPNGGQTGVENPPPGTGSPSAGNKGPVSPAGAAAASAGSGPQPSAAVSESQPPSAAVSEPQRPVANSSAQRASEAPAALISGRYYVVLGVFSTPENAARAVVNASEKLSGPEYGVYRFGEKFMVSAFDATDAEACARFVREYGKHFPGLWTYKAR